MADTRQHLLPSVRETYPQCVKRTLSAWNIPSVRETYPQCVKRHALVLCACCVPACALHVFCISISIPHSKRSLTLVLRACLCSTREHVTQVTTLLCTNDVRHAHMATHRVSQNRVYMHCIWPYITWIPCQTYCIYTAHLYICIVLANP
jgi:hypothetical protein